MGIIREWKKEFPKVVSKWKREETESVEGMTKGSRSNKKGWEKRWRRIGEMGTSEEEREKGQ